MFQKVSDYIQRTNCCICNESHLIEDMDRAATYSLNYVCQKCRRTKKLVPCTSCGFLEEQSKVEKIEDSELTCRPCARFYRKYDRLLHSYDEVIEREESPVPTKIESHIYCAGCSKKTDSKDKIHYRADDYCLACVLQYVPGLICGCCQEIKSSFTKLSDHRCERLLRQGKLSHTAVCKDCYDKRIKWDANNQEYQLMKSAPPVNTGTFQCEDCKKDYPYCSSEPAARADDRKQCLACWSKEYFTKNNKLVETEPVSEVQTKPVEEQTTMNNAMSMDRLMGGALGPDTSGKFKASMMGIAIKNNEGVYCIYDGEQMVDVMDFIMPGFGDVFKMPASSVEIGDLILHQGEAHYVRDVNEDKTIEVLNPFTSKVERLMPTKNLLGFKFFVKIVSMSDMFGFGKMDLNSENPFGNMGQMMMMSMMFGGGGDGKNNPMSGMFGGGSDATNPFGGMMGMMMMSQMFGGKDQENPMSNLFGGLNMTMGKSESTGTKKLTPAQKRALAKPEKDRAAEKETVVTEEQIKQS